MKTENQNVRDRACKFALSSLSRCDYSKKALYAKLLAKGFDSPTASEALNYVVSFGYIDERRQIERIILDLFSRNGYGKRKIAELLLRRGYCREDISACLRSLTDSGEIDFDMAKERLLSKYPANLSDEERKKILYKYGFSDV